MRCADIIHLHIKLVGGGKFEVTIGTRTGTTNVRYSDPYALYRIDGTVTCRFVIGPTAHEQFNINSNFCVTIASFFLFPLSFFLSSGQRCLKHPCPYSKWRMLFVSLWTMLRWTASYSLGVFSVWNLMSKLLLYLWHQGKGEFSLQARKMHFCSLWYKNCFLMNVANAALIICKSCKDRMVNLVRLIAVCHAESLYHCWRKVFKSGGGHFLVSWANKQKKKALNATSGDTSRFQLTSKKKKQNKTKKYSVQKQILMVLTLPGFYLHVFLSSATYTLLGKESLGGGGMGTRSEGAPEVGTILMFSFVLCRKIRGPSPPGSCGHVYSIQFFLAQLYITVVF